MAATPTEPPSENVDNENQLEHLKPAMDWRDRIVIDPKILVGKPVIKGTRISVEMVIDLLGRGYSKEQILDQYDHITVEDIQACLAYAGEVLKSDRVYVFP